VCMSNSTISWTFTRAAPGTNGGSGSVGGVSAQGGERLENKAPEDGGGAATLSAPLGVLDIAACYSIMSVASVRCVVETLCVAVNEAALSKEAWIVTRHLLLGTQSVATFNHLIRILTRSSASRVQTFSTGWRGAERAAPPARTRASRAEGEQGDEHGAEGARPGLVRGAIYLVSMSAWGSAKVDSLVLLYSRQAVLEALLACLENHADKHIALELMLSIDRLLKAMGHSLQYEWPLILRIIQKIAIIILANGRGRLAPDAPVDGAHGMLGLVGSAGGQGASTAHSAAVRRGAGAAQGHSARPAATVATGWRNKAAFGGSAKVVLTPAVSLLATAAGEPDAFGRTKSQPEPHDGAPKFADNPAATVPLQAAAPPGVSQCERAASQCEAV
jgi:hypothetical protein